jgi:acetylornithine deacetylase/succinyl-diaminopimelate desuccinylase-like protein
LGNSYRISLMDSIREGYIQTDPGFIGICRGAATETGMKPFIEFSNGWGDVQVFDIAGIITLNLGPGTIGQAHRTPEYCSIPGLVNGTQAVLNAIRRWDAQ